jgi:RNA polymerase sigma-70 factor (ECF subfamily)
MARESPGVRDASLLESVQLLSRVRAGDRAARDEFVARHTPNLRRWIDARLPAAARPAADASDLTQEVFAKAFRSLDRFDHRGLGSTWAWLRTIARNEILMIARSLEARRPAVGIPESRLAPAHPAPGPATLAQRGEDSGRLELALAGLPERERHAVLLRYELELEFATIARECGHPSSDAARMAIARAVSRLGQQLGAE